MLRAPMTRKVRRKVSARRSGDPPELVADASLASEVLGWGARRSLHDIVGSAWNSSQKQQRRGTTTSRAE
jgi:UDP-glucose 4-epimerase